MDNPRPTDLAQEASLARLDVEPTSPEEEGPEDARITEPPPSPPPASVRAVLLSETALTRKWSLEVSDGPDVFAFYLREPRVARGRVPAVLMLAGFETGRAALDLVDERDDLLLMSMDYPDHGVGTLDNLRSVGDIGALQAIGIDAQRSARRALDYLVQRDDVDPDRIVVLGVSFGSIFATALVAQDPRPNALVVIYGGGDLGLLVEHHTRGARPDWLPAWGLAGFVELTFGHLEPLRWVPMVAPRPVLIVGSKHDVYFPEPSIKALYDAAGVPKELVWIDADHMALFEPAVLRRVTGEVIARLAKLGVLATP